jgi:PKD repeat protein
VFGTFYRYARGDDEYDRLASRIDEARAAGIPWVVVGMHMVCLSSGLMPCEIGTDLLNLLVEKRVDLILQGHDHTYQRSKQLAHSATCPEIQANAFDADCVADDGSDHRYPKGKGPIVVINGAFGASLSEINESDPETDYFAKLMGWGTPGSGFGFTSFTVTSTSIEARTNLSGTFQDAFSIEALPPSSPRTPSAHPDAASIALAWQAPAWDGGLPVTDYRIYRGTASGNLAFLTQVGNVLSYADTDLTNGRTYYYEISAVNAAGEGEPSEEVSATAGSVPGPLQVTVSSSATRGLAPLSVSFTSTVTGGLDPYTYFWTFGDGGTSQEPDPVHTFADPGDYDVDVVVTDSMDGVARADVSVSVYASLTAVATVSAAVGPVPLAVSFSATVGGGRPPYSFVWDFGDGNGSSSVNPSYTYREPGNYVAKLTVTDATGQTVVKMLPITASSAGDGTPRSPGNFPFATSEVFLAIAIGAIGGAVGVVVWYMRGHRPPRRRP